MFKKQITNILGCKEHNTYFIFSGRVAINLIARKNKKHGKVLIPEYICNVVDKAFIKEGYTVIRYPIDDNFEPSFEKIKEIILKEKIDIILFVSLYGSGKWINTIKEESLFLKLIRAKDIKLILDLAQDLSLINQFKEKLPMKTYIISSFNFKSIPNIMGGIIITKEKLDIQYKKLEFKNKFIIFKMFIINYLDCKHKKLLEKYKRFRNINNSSVIDDSYEYSECTIFPYQFEHYKPTFLQQYLAYIGIKKLDKYNKKKLQFLNTIKVKKTPFYKTATYVICDNNVSDSDRLKKPYAINNQPNTSIYPELKICSNRGYCNK